MSDEEEYTAHAEADTALAELANEFDEGAPPVETEAPSVVPDSEASAKTRRVDPEAEAEAEPAPTEGEAAPSEEPAPEAEPDPDPAADVVDWSFRAYGQELSVPGAKYKPGHGAFIPEESLAMTRQLIARGIKYEKVQAERERLTQGLLARELEAKAVVEVLAPLLDPQRLTEAALNPDYTIKELRLALKERQLQLQQEHGQRLVQPDATQDEAEFVGQVQEQIDSTLTEIIQSVPDIKAVLTQNKAAMQQVIPAAREAATAFYVPAPFDHPQGAFRKGELVLDTHRLAQYVRGLVTPYAQQAAPAPKAPPAAPKPPATAVTAPPAPGRVARTATTTTAPSASRAKAPPTKDQIRDELDAALRELAQ